MKFEHTKHDVGQFVYDFKVLEKMIGMADDQMLQHFERFFSLNIEPQCLKNNTIDTAIVQVRVFVL